MTDEEIMKKIEWVIKCNKGELKNCIGCPVTEHYPYCDDIIIKASLALIKRQKAEIESLRADVAKEFTCFVGEPHKVEHCPYLDELETAKAEAIKEFWELLKECGKERVDYYTPEGCDLYFSNGTFTGYVAMKEAGDSLIKEMVNTEDK